jgi:outer membrane lipoprotein-sorting protein
MKLYAILVLALFVLPCRYATAEPNAPEKLYREMEAALTKARTIECHFDMRMQACPGGEGTGLVLLGEENKSRIEVPGENAERHNDADIVVCDGKRMKWRGLGRPALAVAKWHNQALRFGFCRAGFAIALDSMTILGPEDETSDFKPDEAFEIRDFKVEKKETVGRQEAQVIRYVVVTNEHTRGPENVKEKRSLAVTLWIDSKTKLPLKRVVTPMEKDRWFIVTETYRRLTLDGKIDAKKFELPKE